MSKFKEIFESTSADLFSSLALVIFVLVFPGVCVWVLSRRKRTIDRWARMPLDDHTPQDPRPRKDAQKDSQGNGGDAAGDDVRP
jgi:cbb3-type cytochrome oxidase subunit 3